MKLKGLLLTLALLVCRYTAAKAQQGDTTARTKDTSSITWSGFAEVYYAYTPNQQNKAAPYFYSHNRNNEFAVNLLFLNGKYVTEHVRASLGLMTGTYPEANLAHEPTVLRQLYDGNIGVWIGKRTWLDAGVFGLSHIGIESIISKDNWTLTRSLCAENTPYYETGLRLSRESASKKWTMAALLLNGWQNIQDNNRGKALGTQLTWKPTDSLTLNYSTFFGNEKPDTAHQYRSLHDLYATWQINTRIGITAGMDFGLEQKKSPAQGWNTWYNPTLLILYAYSPKWKTTFRAEYYNDPAGVIINTGTLHNFQVQGYSINLDHMPYSNVWIRLEGRLLRSRDAIFTSGNQLASTCPRITASLAIAF